MATFKKVKKLSKLPTSLIVNGACLLGQKLAVSLLDQKGRVIILDEFVKGKGKYIENLKANELFTFLDVSALETLDEDIENLDYVFFLIHETPDPRQEISTKEFLANSNNLDKILKLSVERNVKFLLASSIKVNRYILAQKHLAEDGKESEDPDSGYTRLELQRYAESLVTEYNKKAGLDTRIVRLGEVYGPGMVFKQDKFSALIKQAVKGENLTVEGDGLESDYYIHILDATYGIIKAQFANETKGKIFSCMNKDDLSILSLAYKILDLEPSAKEIEFVKERGKLALSSSLYNPAQNLSKIGWQPRVSIDRGIAQTIDYAYEHFGISRPRVKIPLSEGISVKRKPFEGGEKTFLEKLKELSKQKKEKKVVEAVPPEEIPQELKVVSQAEVAQLERKKEKNFLNRAWGAISNFFFEEVQETIPEEKTELRPRRKQEVLSKIAREESAGGRKDRRILMGPVNKKRKKRRSTFMLSLWFFVISPFRWFARTPKLRLTIYGVLCALGVLFYIYLYAPGMAFAANVFLSGRDFHAAIESAKDLDLDNAKVSSDKARSELAIAQKNFHNLEWLFSIGGQKSFFNKTSKLLSAGQYYMEGSSQLMEGGKPYIEFAQNFDVTFNLQNDGSFNVESNAPMTVQLEEMSKNSDLFTKASMNFEQGDKLFEQTSIDTYPFIGERLKSLKSDLDKFSEYLPKGESLAKVLPDIIGHKGVKNYLILFQNNTELRSTGGFIGSYAVVTFDQGRITNLIVDDVYNPDGQLKEYVEMPEPFVEAFQQEGELISWSLRNSNWSPDFPSSAVQAESFYKKSGGEEIHGVFGINLYLIEELLNITGPVTLRDEGIAISNANLFEEAEKHQIGFQPGSTEKSDFLRDLAASMFIELSEMPRDKWTLIVEQMESLLEEKQVMLYFDDSELNEFVQEMGWGGNVYQGDGDYLMILDNNMGGNKVNYYVGKTIEVNAAIKDDRSLEYSLEIVYENRSRTTEWPGGTYRNYLRVYVPKGAEFVKSHGFEDSVDVVDELGKTYFGGWVEVLPNSKKSVKLEYTIENIAKEGVIGYNYKCYLQKQSGIEGDSTRVNIYYPSDWLLDKWSGDLQVLENKVVYFNSLKRDTEFEISWLK